MERKEQPNPNTGQTCDRCLIRETDSDDEGLKTVVYETVGSESDTDEDVRISSIKLSAVRCLHTTIKDEDWRRSSTFHTYITHKGKNYKLMIDGGSCANIIAKTTFKKMGLKAEPHPTYTT